MDREVFLRSLRPTTLYYWEPVCVHEDVKKAKWSLHGSAWLPPVVVKTTFAFLWLASFAFLGGVLVQRMVYEASPPPPPPPPSPMPLTPPAPPAPPPAQPPPLSPCDWFCMPAADEAAAKAECSSELATGSAIACYVTQHPHDYYVGRN